MIADHARNQHQPEDETLIPLPPTEISHLFGKPITHTVRTSWHGPNWSASDGYTKPRTQRTSP